MRRRGFSKRCDRWIRRTSCVGNTEGTPAVQVDSPDSQVETFAAVRIYLDCWRWADVPFYIRAGKKLPVTTTEILVELQDPPQAVFGGEQPVESNYYRFRLSPDVMISIGARTKVPGETMRGEAVALVAHHHPGDEMAPYERLLEDAMRGDASLFVREDSVEAAWEAVDPVLVLQL